MGCLAAIVGAVGVFFVGFFSLVAGPAVDNVFEEVVTELEPVAVSGLDYSNVAQNRMEDGGFVLGAADAPVTIVAFEDFLCPHCQRYQATLHPFIATYVMTGQARFEYRMLPAVDPTFSQLTAQMAECSVEQGVSFWVAHDLLFELASEERFSNSTARTFAERLNMDYATLLECASEAEQVFTDSQLANQIGVSGTPTIGVRLGDGPIQLGLVSQQPTFEELGAFIEANQ